MLVARPIIVDWCTYTSKLSVVKWGQPCFKGAYRHELQNKLTVKNAAQVKWAFVKKPHEKPIFSWKATITRLMISMATITVSS